MIASAAEYNAAIGERLRKGKDKKRARQGKSTARFGYGKAEVEQIFEWMETGRYHGKPLDVTLLRIELGL